MAVPLLIAWGFGLIVMITVALQSDERAAQLLLDPSQTSDLYWYSGLVSNVGILAWTIAAGAGAAGAWICRLGGRVSAQRFLAAGSLVSSIMLIDDLLQLHSSLVPDITGLPKGIVETIVALVAIRWMIQYRPEVRRTHQFLLVASVGALAVSILVDLVIAPRQTDFALLIEDGAKFFGVLAWAAYFVVTARDIGRSVFTDALLTWPDEAYDAAFGEGSFEADVSLLPEIELDTSPSESVSAASSSD